MSNWLLLLYGSGMAAMDVKSPSWQTKSTVKEELYHVSETFSGLRSQVCARERRRERERKKERDRERERERECVCVCV